MALTLKDDGVPRLTKFQIGSPYDLAVIPARRDCEITHLESGYLQTACDPEKAVGEEDMLDLFFVTDSPISSGQSVTTAFDKWVGSSVSLGQNKLRFKYRRKCKSSFS